MVIRTLEQIRNPHWIDPEDGEEINGSFSLDSLPKP